MQRRIGLAICLFCLLLVLGACGERNTGPAAQSDAPVYEVTDIRGYTTQLAAKPQRILTLSLGTDEILLGLVEPERIAAVNQLLDDPVNSNVTALASRFSRKLSNPSVEEIAALQPELVILPDWGEAAKADALYRTCSTMHAATIRQARASRPSRNMRERACMKTPLRLRS